MSDSILYKVRSGKPIKFWYFIRKYMGLVIPDSWYRIRLEQRLCRVSSRPDYPYIQERVNYYIQLDRTRPIPSENRLAHHQSWLHYTGPIGQYRSNMFHKAYYFRPARHYPLVSAFAPLELLSGRCLFHSRRSCHCEKPADLIPKSEFSLAEAGQASSFHVCERYQVIHREARPSDLPGENPSEPFADQIPGEVFRTSHVRLWCRWEE